MFSALKCLRRVKFSFATAQTQKVFQQRIDRLVQTIRQQLNPTFLRVRDISLKTIDDDQMIRVEVESQKFINIPKVDQHRMVISCFGEAIQDFHAFLIKTRIPILENLIINKVQEQVLINQLNQQGTIPLQNITKLSQKQAIKEKIQSENEQSITEKDLTEKNKTQK